MREILTQVAQGEQQNILLEPKPREFSTHDVVNVQMYLQRLHDKSIANNADYMPSKDGLYDALTENPIRLESEQGADEYDFDKTVNVLLSAWGELRGWKDGAPRSLVEAQDFFTKNPIVNDISPIHFQGGAEYASGRFVHVTTGRAMNMHREPATRRYYLNPTAEKMGYVVEQLTAVALQSRIPLYFKFVNVATGSPSRRTMERDDRVVIYASDAQVDFIESELSRIVTEIPEAFTGRSVSGFGEVLMDGIVRADDVTKEQNEKFKGYASGVSFNSLRSELVYKAMLDVTRDLIVFPEFASIKIDNQTIRQRFVRELSKAIGTHGNNVAIGDTDPDLLCALNLGLSSEQLKQSGQFSDKAIRAIEDAVARTARDTLTSIRPDGLFMGFNRHIKRIAPKYGIDPDNLARNTVIAS